MRIMKGKKNIIILSPHIPSNNDCAWKYKLEETSYLKKNSGCKGQTVWIWHFQTDWV